jgi:hypothetical protein
MPQIPQIPHLASCGLVATSNQAGHLERKTRDTVSSLTWLPFCSFSQTLIWAVMVFTDPIGEPFGHTA